MSRSHCCGASLSLDWPLLLSFPTTWVYGSDSPLPRIKADGMAGIQDVPFFTQVVIFSFRVTESLGQVASILYLNINKVTVILYLNIHTWRKTNRSLSKIKWYFACFMQYGFMKLVSLVRVTLLCKTIVKSCQ